MSNDYPISIKNKSMNSYKSVHPVKMPLLALLVRLDIFTRTLFLGRRQKVRFMGRMLLAQTRSRR